MKTKIANVLAQWTHSGRITRTEALDLIDRIEAHAETRLLLGVLLAATFCAGTYLLVSQAR